MRKQTRTATVGSVRIGGGNPIVLQSMTKTETTDVAGCLKQIQKLVKAGAGLVRIAVPTRADTEAFGKIVHKSPIPLVADIHFSPDRAIEAIEAGAAKIRLNPGNVKNKDDILRIIDCAKHHKIAIRIGVNEASIRDLKHDVGRNQRVTLMLEEMTGYVRMFEQNGFENLVLSAKSADTVRTIQINRAISDTFDYPVHIGLTHAGLLEDALVPSSVAIGTLLAEGIGDTVRVSIAGDPVQEIEAGKKILASVGLYKQTQPELIVCPTCGRCQIDVVGLAKKVRKLLQKSNKPIRVAVMGCVVNGPGEAADADLAICAGTGKGFLYKNGQKIAAVDEANLLDAISEQLLTF
ncbi:MAG TPA: flavodoxin-dependent (E)-4-hydroxy-3-methylbut-2-enyl-diphosphate synthase [Anaerohalosphaeraceae bacterium]|nr:flavodoxin-dependent (E)-4-hydroxy-3-methylbut-2-enyl-diphosphate synthase [Anaerohalosphaeraceae bacterium]